MEPNDCREEINCDFIEWQSFIFAFNLHNELAERNEFQKCMLKMFAQLRLRPYVVAFSCDGDNRIGRVAVEEEMAFFCRNFQGVGLDVIELAAIDGVGLRCVPICPL